MIVATFESFDKNNWNKSHFFGRSFSSLIKLAEKPQKIIIFILKLNCHLGMHYCLLMSDDFSRENDTLSL